MSKRAETLLITAGTISTSTPGPLPPDDAQGDVGNDGLDPNTIYYYHHIAAGHVAPTTGRTMYTEPMHPGTVNVVCTYRAQPLGFTAPNQLWIWEGHVPEPAGVQPQNITAEADLLLTVYGEGEIQGVSFRSDTGGYIDLELFQWSSTTPSSGYQSGFVLDQFSVPLVNTLIAGQPTDFTLISAVDFQFAILQVVGTVASNIIVGIKDSLNNVILAPTSANAYGWATGISIPPGTYTATLTADRTGPEGVQLHFAP